MKDTGNAPPELSPALIDYAWREVARLSEAKEVYLPFSYRLVFIALLRFVTSDYVNQDEATGGIYISVKQSSIAELAGVTQQTAHYALRSFETIGFVETVSKVWREPKRTYIFLQMVGLKYDNGVLKMPPRVRESFRIFNEEQKIALNQMALDAPQSVALDKIRVAMAVNDDEDIKDLLNELYQKVASLSIEVWNELQDVLPFDVSIPDDDIDESLIDEI